MALLTDRIALGQAGSTGGTIGKTDKSSSGGEISEPSDHRATRTKEKTKQHAFQNPIVDGQRVDYCLLANARGCGQEAADAWCRRNGLSHATSWKTEKAPEGYKLGDAVTSCNPFAGGCDVFTLVYCN